MVPALHRALVGAAVFLAASCSTTASPDTVPGHPSTSSADGSGPWWRPPVGTAWQWQLSGPLDASVAAAVYDVDGQLTSAAQVADLHRRGRRVICYVSVGSFEPERPDAGRFPADVVGRPLEGFPDERWLDVRRLDVLLPILRDRITACRDKGFDAVEPDNVDGYANDSGFPLGSADQLRFDRAVAALAHEVGLGVALKNDGDQVADLEPDTDFAVVEECVRYDECDLYRPFVDAGKAVLAVEYDRAPDEFCPKMQRLGFSGMRKRWELDAYREPCPTPASSPDS